VFEIVSNRRNNELKSQIDDVGEQIRELKHHVNSIVKNDLDSCIKRVSMTEELLERLSSQFNQSNRLTIAQTDELLKALERVKEEIKDQTNSNQNLIKKSAPVIAFLTVLASIALEIFKYIFK
jgi:archaellum component FlaC